VIAAAKLPSVTEAPLHFRAVAVNIPRSEKSSASPGNSILYRLSGSTQILAGAETRTLRAAEGLFIAEGTAMVLNAGNDGASNFIQFFLVPAVDLVRPAASAPAAVTELFRTKAPIPDLKSGGYDLNLTRVTFPAHFECTPPQVRSSSVLHHLRYGG
jgi:hypothetical protein